MDDDDLRFIVRRHRHDDHGRGAVSFDIELYPSNIAERHVQRHAICGDADEVVCDGDEVSVGRRLRPYFLRVDSPSR